MTENDKLFMQTLATVSKSNRENPAASQSIRTTMDLLSPDLLKLFVEQSNTQGAWFFNVYVEFEPMFKTQNAKDWQK